MSYLFVDQSSREPLPPLRIHHFLLWTGVSAVFFATLKSCSAANPEATTGIVQGSSIPWLLIESLAISSLIFGLIWKSRGLPFFHQPGHSAFVIHSLEALFMLTWLILWNYNDFFDLSNDSWQTWLYLYGWHGQQAIYLFIYIYFAYHFSQPRSWRFFFLLQALSVAFQIAGYLTLNFWFSLFSPDTVNTFFLNVFQAVVFYAPNTIVVIVLGFVVVKDIRNQVLYHWSHWLGVGTWFVIWIASIFHWVWLLFFPEVHEIDSTFILE